VQQYDKHSSNKLTKKQIFEIVANKLKDTDTIEELVEAMKLFDLDKDGKIEVKELRWAMT
jgi:calmodulin